MKTEILVNLPFQVDKNALMEKMNIDEDFEDEFSEIFDHAMAIANPKIVYGAAAVEVLDERNVLVGGISFSSRVLSINMKDVKSAYPYVCTCGRELYEFALSQGDPLSRYWVDEISEAVLGGAMKSAGDAIREKLGTKSLFAMSPGSLPDWPTSEQRPLFRLLGDVMEKIGVELTESCLMLPVKTVSGLYFESDEHYTNCALCPREHCPNRREPFNPHMFYEKYGLDMPESFAPGSGHEML